MISLAIAAVSRGLAVRTLTLLAIACSASALSAQAGVSPTAPTASQDPEVIDSIWQKASSMYDHQRGQILGLVDQTVHGGPYRPDWESLQKYEPPTWYRDAKFVIFIHWGVYSVPAFGSEWYPRQMYRAGSEENQHQVSVYGPVTKFGYKDFIPMFKAEKWDPAQWVALFKKAGAKYI